MGRFLPLEFQTNAWVGTSACPVGEMLINLEPQGIF